MNDQTKEGLKRGAFQCLWPVPKEGFEWRSDLEQRPGTNQGPVFKPDPFKRPPWLVCQSTRPNYMTFRDDSCTKWYSPLRYPKLHRRFAKLEPTEDSIIRFSNRFGFLAHEFGTYRYGSALGRRDLGVEVYGEPFSTWVDAIIKMKRLVEFWDHLRSGNHGKLASIVTGWEKKPLQIGIKHVYTQYQNSVQSIVPKTGKDDELIEYWRKSSIKYSGPVLRYVIDEINEEIEMNTTVKLDNSQPRGFEISIMPTTLLCSMFILFALEVTDYEEPLAPKICRECGKTFEAPTRRKIYCSDACRAKSHYYRSARSKRATLW